MQRERFVPLYKQRRKEREQQGRSMRNEWALLHRAALARWDELAREPEPEPVCAGPNELKLQGPFDSVSVCTWKGGAARPCKDCPHRPGRADTPKLVDSIKSATVRELANQVGLLDVWVEVGEGAVSPENQVLAALIQELKRAAPSAGPQVFPQARDASRRTRSGLLREAVRDFLRRSR